MHWILYAVGLIFFSTISYLGVRLAKDLAIPLLFRNLAMFLLPAILFLIVNLIQGHSLVLTPLQAVQILVSAIFFSWIGNSASLRALELAPNQGYSLIISKSYVVFTSVVSVWLFAAPLTRQDLLAILAIIGFSALIVIEKKVSQPVAASRGWLNNWFTLTMVAFFAWGLLAINNRFLLLSGLPATVILFYSSIIVSLLILGQIWHQKMQLSLPGKSGFLLVLIGIGLTFFNFFQVAGYAVAPNPGYMNAANAGSISLVTVASALIFKDELNLKKFLGVVGVALGLLLLFL